MWTMHPLALQLIEERQKDERRNAKRARLARRAKDERQIRRAQPADA